MPPITTRSYCRYTLSSKARKAFVVLAPMACDSGFISRFKFAAALYYTESSWLQFSLANIDSLTNSHVIGEADILIEKHIVVTLFCNNIAKNDFNLSWQKILYSMYYIVHLRYVRNGYFAVFPECSSKS